VIERIPVEGERVRLALPGSLLVARTFEQPTAFVDAVVDQERLVHLLDMLIEPLQFTVDPDVSPGDT